MAGADAAPRQPADLDPAAGARLHAAARSSGLEHLDADRRPGDLRRQSPEPLRHAGHPAGAAAALALPRRAGDGQGVLQGALLPRPVPLARRARPTARTTTSPRCSSTRSRSRSGRRGTRQTLRYIGELVTDGYSVLIFPEGRRTGGRQHRHVPAGGGDDRRPARRSR